MFDDAQRNAQPPTGARGAFSRQDERWPRDAVRLVHLQRVPQITEQSAKSDLIDARPTVNGDASATKDARSTQTPPEPRPEPPGARTGTRKRKLLAGVVGIAVIAVLLVFGIPWIEGMLNTVSTDDAYVNGHVTFVAPRLA